MELGIQLPVEKSAAWRKPAVSGRAGRQETAGLRQAAGRCKLPSHSFSRWLTDKLQRPIRIPSLSVTPQAQRIQAWQGSVTMVSRNCTSNSHPVILL